MPLLNESLTPLSSFYNIFVKTRYFWAKKVHDLAWRLARLSEVVHLIFLIAAT